MFKRLPRLPHMPKDARLFAESDMRAGDLVCQGSDWRLVNTSPVIAGQELVRHFRQAPLSEFQLPDCGNYPEANQPNPAQSLKMGDCPAQEESFG